jgi:uncharacterized protein YecE (DUF72 family)
MALRIGTSGWNYPSGRGTWTGIFYPLPQDQDRGFDELRFYAQRFTTVEVNSTFYGQPRATASLGWLKRTPAHFDFSVKLFQKFTHPAMAQATAKAGALQEAITREDVDAFKAGIEPLAVAGRLGALLVQFPPSFHDTAEARGYLEWLLGAFADYPIAVELRHRSWSDGADDTRALLDVRNAAWVQIDEPKFESSIVQDLAPGSGELFYIRLHGRNAAQWWEHAEAEDRYNYLYSPEELEPIAEKVRQARALGKKVYLYLNNHFSASAVANATMLKHMLDEPVTARMPIELVERYPALAGIVSTLPRARLI